MPTTPCALQTKHAHPLHLKRGETEDEGLERKLATHGLAASGQRPTVVEHELDPRRVAAGCVCSNQSFPGRNPTLAFVVFVLGNCWYIALNVEAIASRII